MGRSLFYFLSQEWFVAASEVQGVLRHPAVSADLDDSWLTNFFALRTPRNSTTPFRAVTELLPGERLTVTREGHEMARSPPDIGAGRIRFSRARVRGTLR